MSALIDTEVLDVLIDAIGAEAARGVIELFIAESGELTGTITAPGADRVKVGRAAHSLKSSAGQLGAAALSAAALAVETAANEGSPALSERIAALVQCAAATRQALFARLNP